jgi:hypothetical protein
MEDDINKSNEDNLDINPKVQSSPALNLLEKKESQEN